MNGVDWCSLLRSIATRHDHFDVFSSAKGTELSDPLAAFRWPWSEEFPTLISKEWPSTLRLLPTRCWSIGRRGWTAFDRALFDGVEMNEVWVNCTCILVTRAKASVSWVCWPFPVERRHEIDSQRSDSMWCHWRVPPRPPLAPSPLESMHSAAGDFHRSDNRCLLGHLKEQRWFEASEEHVIITFNDGIRRWCFRRSTPTAGTHQTRGWSRWTRFIYEDEVNSVMHDRWTYLFLPMVSPLSSVVTLAHPIEI